MNRYWRENPPTHLLVAAYLGIGSGAKESKKGDLGDLIREFGLAGGKVEPGVLSNGGR